VRPPGEEAMFRRRPRPSLGRKTAVLIGTENWLASASIPPDALPATFSRHALAFCVLGDVFSPGAILGQGEFAPGRFDVLGGTEGNGAVKLWMLSAREDLPPAA
jgi:hypothetical protein